MLRLGVEWQGHRRVWWELILQADGLSGRSLGGLCAFQALEVHTEQMVICLDREGKWGSGWLKARDQVRLDLDFVILFVCIGLSVSEDCSPFWNCLVTTWLSLSAAVPPCLPVCALAAHHSGEIVIVHFLLLAAAHLVHWSFPSLRVSFRVVNRE